MGRYQEALADLDRAIVLNDQNELAFAERGEIYHQMGRYQEALADLDRAIALNYQNAWVIERRGNIYDDMGLYQEALADYDRTIALDKNLQYILDRAVALSHLREYAKAIENYKQVLNKNPNDFRVLYNIAVAVARWKSLSEAQIYINKTRLEINKRKTDSVTLYVLGGLSALSGNTDEALDYLQQAIQ